MYYLVEIDTDSGFFNKFKRFFRQYEKDYNPADYCYAGFVVGNDDDGRKKGQDIYSTTDDEDEYPGTEVISMTEWAARFPGEGNLTTLPEYYLVELDSNSPFYKEFRHFLVDQTDDDLCLSDTYVGHTEHGWLSTDDADDYNECDILTMEEWKALRTIHHEIY